MPRTLFLSFNRFQRLFVAKSLAFSRKLNPRNLECYWYAPWNETLCAMIHGVSAHLLVAPQYHLWCVHPEDEAPEAEEEGSEDEDIGDAHASDDVEDDKELLGGIDEERPQSPSTLAGLVDPAQDADTSFSLTATVPQSRATTQITD